LGSPLRLAVPFHGPLRPPRLFLHLLKIVPRDGLERPRAMEHGWGIGCCIVMCHRLKQSRIATNGLAANLRFNPSRRTARRWKPRCSAVLSKSGAASRTMSPLRPTPMQQPCRVGATRCHSRISSFPCGDQSAPDSTQSEAVRRTIVEFDWQIQRGGG
jgi:hypothetical protein